ncbi:MAG: amidohydrolase family protein [Ectothiorhodospiraceae bacterium]|nr:amidohydrolase family protein [Ectothiorhodospiraceae bacterium]
MSQILIHDGTVVTMDPARRVIEGGAVLVEGVHIRAVGSMAEVAPLVAADAERIDARRMVVIPGLVDGHGHAGHGLVKSLGAGHAGAWVDACLAIYAHGSTAAFWAAEAALVSLERLKAGVTTSVSLMGGGTDLIRNDTPEYALAYADAMGRAGTRGYLAMGPNRAPFPHRFVRGEDASVRELDLDAQMAVVEETLRAGRGLHDDRVRFCLTAPVYGADRAADGLDPGVVRETFERVMDLRARTGVLFTQDGHRDGSLAYALELGALGPWALMSHSVDLTEADIAAVVETDARIVHNPSAIMSIWGRCPVPELIDAGVTVMLGSDGAAPDRGYDMFRHMAQCMHYHRRHFRDPKILPAGKVLEMATIDAARALGRESELGSLEPGKKADIVLVDMHKPHLLPLNMPVNRLAHFANAADVDTVLVDGRVVLRNRRALLVDEPAVLEAAEAEASRVMDALGLRALTEPPPGFWGSSRLS